jgi:hypothetical protein
LQYVYVIGVTGMQAVKIGTAGDCNARMSSLQIGCPLKMELLWERAADNAFGVERALHERFSAQRIRGEWFNLGLDPVPLITDAFSELSRIEPPDMITPRETVVRDVIRVADEMFAGRKFIDGNALGDELRRLDNPLYDNDHHLACRRIADALPLAIKLVKVNGKLMKGYFMQDIQQLKEEMTT